jgi:hypothetical protein
VLLVDAPRDAGGRWRPAVRILTACRILDGATAHVRGRRVDADLFEYAGLPVGACRVEVFDGLGASLPATVEVPPHGAGRAAVAFPEPTGLALRLQDAEGRRTFDADLVLVLPAGVDRGGVDLARLTRYRPGPRGPLEVVHPLRPGVYRYAVAKRGVGETGGEFLVREGEVTRVAAVLGAPRGVTASGPVRGSP